ncbi:MAG: nucleoid-associated protein [Peptostreptococcaceae bacterium]
MIIHKCIIHVLDKNNDFPILNDFESKMNGEVDRFLQKSIKKVLNDDDLRVARFKDYKENRVRNLCEQMINFEDTFVENSKEIASYLFEIMKINESLDSCDLAICSYSDGEETNIGIIKLNYKKLFTHSIEFIDDKFNIQMVPNNIGIQENAKIKKCAIISNGSINDEFHLTVLDKVTENKDDESKFIESFLECERISDDNYKTKVFKRTTEAWVNNTLGEDMKKAEEVKRMLHFTLKEKEDLSPEKFMNSVLEEEKLKDSFKEVILNKGIENEFIIDKKWVNKTLKKRSIKTDNGFEIKSDLLNFEDPMKYSIRKNENGTFDIVIKNISFVQ